MPLVEPRGAPRPTTLRLVAGAWALLFSSCWEEPMPYAVYEALLMGVPVVAFPIGGQAELISQTPSAQFTAEEMSAKAFIKAAVRAAAVPRREMENLRKITAETATMILDRQSLYTILINTLKSHDDTNGNRATWHETGR